MNTFSHPNVHANRNSGKLNPATQRQQLSNSIMTNHFYRNSKDFYAQDRKDETHDESGYGGQLTESIRLGAEEKVSASNNEADREASLTTQLSNSKMDVGMLRSVVQRDFISDLTEDPLSALGIGNNILSVLTSGAQTAGNATVLGALGLGGKLGGALADTAPALAGVSSLSKTGLGRAVGTTGNIAGGLGTALGAYNLATSRTGEDRIQAAADTAFSAAGFFGPVGTALSGGYAAGQLGDQAIGAVTGTKPSDALGDAMYDTLGPAPKGLIDAVDWIGSLW